MTAGRAIVAIMQLKDHARRPERTRPFRTPLAVPLTRRAARGVGLRCPARRNLPRRGLLCAREPLTFQG
ncbi:hypothetical protein PSP6_330033 [Paraburkholderia tropica]|nr:hypothetical protein PSP6_330033 [Paraburkholderia tropica]